MDFTEITKKIWSIYLEGSEEEYRKFVEKVDPDCVIIGTGKHEFYQNLNAFTEENPGYGMALNSNRLVIKNYWCEQKQISEDMYLVFGELAFFRTDKVTEYKVMESRFSIIYKEVESGFKIIHIHQSVPNTAQAAGEYYPMLQSNHVIVDKDRVDTLEELAHKDGLTGLYNYRAFCDICENKSKPGDWIMVADIDDFKNVNDLHGHLQGNRILKKMAYALGLSVGAHDVICRMGGDEFIVLCRNVESEAEAGKLMKRIMDKSGKYCKIDNYSITLSIGAAVISEGESFEKVIQRADEALYKIKKNGKNGYALK